MEESLLLTKLNYWIFILMMMLGLWAMLSKQNLIKKVMGMSIFQAAIILFYVSIAAKDSGADIPIYPHDLIHPPHVEHSIDSHSNEGAMETPAHHAQSNDHEHDSHAHLDHGHAEDDHAEHDNIHSEQSVKPKSHSDVEDAHAPHYIADKINPDDFNNPLPHVLMLTAIVVGVATLGVALSLIQRIYRLYGSIEENEVLAAITAESTTNIKPESESTAKFEENGSNHS